MSAANQSDDHNAAESQSTKQNQSNESPENDGQQNESKGAFNHHQFMHSKSMIQRMPHDLFNQQLYHHHRLHHHKLNQKCNHHYQCVVYANLIRNQQLEKDRKKNKRKYSKHAKRRKKRTFTKDPPDGGYGWIVVLASFLISLIADGISFSFGMIFVELIKFFGQSKSKTAWVGSLFFAMPLLAGPIASALTDRYGCRLTTIASGLIAFTGFFISSFVQSLEFLYFTFSLTGIGLALCYVSGIVIVAHYFEKRRSLATGLAVAGTGIGTFVFPPLTSYFLNRFQWQMTLIIISCFFLVIMFCGFMIKDLNLEENDENAKYKARKKLHKEQKMSKKMKLLKENSDLSSKVRDEDNCFKDDLKPENVHLLNNNNVKMKNNNDLVKSHPKPSNQASLMTSSSEDSYSLDSESSSSSDDSKSSSTSDLRTINDFNEKLSDQFDKFDNILCSKDEDDDVFESNLLTSCNDLSSNLVELCRSNSAICLPTYLDEMYSTLNTVNKVNGDWNMKNCNLSTTTTPKMIMKNNKIEADQLTSSQFHKDILLNLQKKSYFYKLINVYPFLFPECCREQQKCDCCPDQSHLINQTVRSEREFFINKSKPIKPCIHSFSCDSDMKYESKCDARCDTVKTDPKRYAINKNSINGPKSDTRTQSTCKNVEFQINEFGSKKSELIKQDTISPTTSTITNSTTTTSVSNSINHKIATKTLPNKSTKSSARLEPDTHFRQMKLKRDSISYRSALYRIRMINTPRYRLKASSCPDIYRDSLLSLDRDHSKTNLFSTLKYFFCDIFDTSLLRDYRFALFCISNSCLYACIDVPYIYMPEYAIQKGISEKMASYLISVIGIVNTLGIVIVGYIGDKTWIKTSNLYSLFTTISGFAIFFLPLIHGYEGFVILAAIYGFAISVNYTLITVILVDMLTIERFTTGYGFLLLVQGCSTLFGPPLAGWLFDISGSYNITFYITGICIIFSGIIVLPIDNKLKCSWISNLSRKNSKKSNISFETKNGLTYPVDTCLNNDKDKSFSNLLNA